VQELRHERELAATGGRTTRKRDQTGQRRTGSHGSSRKEKVYSRERSSSRRGSRRRRACRKTQKFKFCDSTGVVWQKDSGTRRELGTVDYLILASRPVDSRRRGGARARAQTQAYHLPRTLPTGWLVCVGLQVGSQKLRCYAGQGQRSGQFVPEKTKTKWLLQTNPRELTMLQDELAWGGGAVGGIRPSPDKPHGPPLCQRRSHLSRPSTSPKVQRRGRVRRIIWGTKYWRLPCQKLPAHSSASNGE
jgi:hypothetical protein